MPISTIVDSRPFLDSGDVEQIIDSYKSVGVVAFRRINADETTVSDICAKMSPSAGWVHAAHENVTMSWPYLQDHDGRIDSLESEGRNHRDTTLIEWHVEGVSMKYPQYGGAWNMFNFKAPAGSGSTGFVDMCQLYEDLSDEERSFFDSATIIHFCNWKNVPTPEMSQAFIDNVLEGNTTIYSKDGDEYVASYARRAVSPHPSTGRPVLRVCPCRNMYGLQDHLLLIDDRLPTEDEREFFASTMNKVIFEISLNPERQMWYDWEEGDLLIVDLFRMAHGVRGGYEPGQRNFQGYWLHESGTPAEPNPRFASLPAKV